jgi:hypothetical protein
MLVPNPPGGYSFLRGIAPYSAGVVANPAFKIERVRMATPLPLDEAFVRMDARLAALGRPPQALCGMELRSPAPFTFDGFKQFNAVYVQHLEHRGILLNGLNPIARTNVAPGIAPPSEPAVYAFSYTIPARTDRRSFIVAGAGELPEGSLQPDDVVRRGESSLDAMTEKVRFVLGLMDGRVVGLGATWDEVTAINVYTVHDIVPFLTSQILPRTGNARNGVTWHYTLPPIQEIEYEMDVRGCSSELVLAL